MYVSLRNIKKASFPLINKRSSLPFDLVHCDIWGHLQSLIYPRLDGLCNLLKAKSEICFIFPNFCNMIKTQFGAKIKKVTADKAKEFLSHTLSHFFLQKGIIRESSCVCNSQQNGIVERKNRHILVVTRALLFHNNVPKQY